MFKIENGIIKNTSLYVEDHGYIVADVIINLQDGGQVVFGGTNLGSILQKKSTSSSTDGNYMGYYIAQLFNVTNTYNFDNIKNIPIRAIFDGNKIVGIMNFMNSSDYFVPNNETKIVFEKFLNNE